MSSQDEAAEWLGEAEPVIAFQLGDEAKAYPLQILTWSRDYGTNPYVGYDDVDSPAFLFQGETDGRLPPKARVISVETPTEDVAYPFEVLSEARVINDTIGNLPVTLFWQEGTASALDSAQISEGEDIGAVGIFSRELNGEVLEFTHTDSGITDEQTGSTWNLLGQAVAGELVGGKARACRS